ncbi:hypothetical protein [Burkholderia sp. PAMC 28687]|uniref:hypothetical protein n=1 Tax=Burkholderia sp. PAMC 28687 TaxID=1795874 RepID=UPI0012D77616|nr:hypothetical protein [Burkholderia sp. PAMC 28687]
MNKQDLIDAVASEVGIAKSAAAVSGKPAALYPASVCVGTISSMFNRMEIGHGGDGRKTIA